MFTDIDLAAIGKKVIYTLSTFGLLSTLGYYLINIENKALSKPQQSPQEIVANNEYSQDSNTSPASQTSTVATVTEVVDGDTLKIIDTDGKKVIVRMLGIDATETANSPRAKQRGVADCFANEAKSALTRMVEGKEVQVALDESKDMYDKYGRLLAYIFVQDDISTRNINEQMIRSGYAYEYTYKGESYIYQVEFKDAQKEAGRTGAGLWAKGACE